MKESSASRGIPLPAIGERRISDEKKVKIVLRMILFSIRSQMEVKSSFPLRGVFAALKAENKN